jgi:ABC-type nitrate/sulfonate/bicarbonate transport system permease component
MRSKWAPPVVAVLLLLALWELVVRAGLIPETSIPPATSAVGELFTQLTESTLWKAVGNTLQGWAIGLGLAVLLGVPAGILIGSSRWAYRALRVPIEFLRPIPSVALIPLAVLVYGTGLQSKVFLATFASFWPLLIQTIYGVQDVDPVATDTARAFQLGRFERLWRITVPSAVPYIATGIRIASAVALILCVTAELVIGSAGLGREINSASSGGNVNLMYAMIIATGLLGWLLNIAATMVERRVLHWHPSQRGVPA